MAVASIDALICKEPSLLADRFERPEVKDITEEAKRYFPEGMSEGEKLAKWRRAYVLTDSYPPFVAENIDKPAWYTDEMSRIFAEVPAQQLSRDYEPKRIF